MRERIREVAREQFVTRGYDGTTIREIARQVGCDSAMVAYYFGAKQRLFRECFNLPLDPVDFVLENLKDGPQGAGERMTRHALQLYEEQFTADTMRTLMHALMTDANTSQRFRHYIRHEVLESVRRELGATKHMAEEIELAISTMYGVATMRYIVRLEPLASMPVERLVRELAPLIQYRIDRIFMQIDGRKR
ncbi:TetR family transcriptional regulator [Actinomycetaceae bacterium L2_0104]